MNVYARVDGRLAKWDSSATEPGMAQVEVRLHGGFKLDGPVLAVINGGRDSFYFASEYEAKYPPIPS